MTREEKSTMIEKVSGGLISMGILIGIISIFYPQDLLFGLAGLMILLGLIGRGLINLMFPELKELKKAKKATGTENRITLLSNSIQIHPTIEAYRLRAEQKMLLNGENWIKSGIDDCDWIINTSPNFADAYVIKSHFLSEEGKTQEAIDCLSKAIELEPSHKVSSNYSRYKVRGTWNLEMGNYEAARSDFKKSIQEKEPNKNTIYYLGECEEKLGNSNLAIEKYKDYLKSKAGYKAVEAKAKVRLINLLRESGKEAEAKSNWLDFKTNRYYFSGFDSADEEMELANKLEKIFN